MPIDIKTPIRNIIAAGVNELVEEVDNLIAICTDPEVEGQLSDAASALAYARYEIEKLKEKDAELVKQHENMSVLDTYCAMVQGAREPEKTEWFPWTIKPVRMGWYEYRGPALAPCRLLWNGTYWEYEAPFGTAQLAEDDGDEWRGLAKGD